MKGEEAFARNRAVVSDNGVIRLMVYAPGITEPLGVVELAPEGAARLAADLIGAAAARLERERNGRAGVIPGSSPGRGPAQ